MFIELIERNKKATAFILTLSLLIGIFVMPTYGAGANDKSILLNNGHVKLKEVSQGGGNINPPGPLEFNEDVKVKLEFDVPVLGDAGRDGSGVNKEDPDTFIQHGDVAWVRLTDEFFKLGSSPGPWTLEYNVGGQTIEIGSLQIITSGTALYAEIDFDGDPSVFDGVGGWYDVVVNFNATLKYNGPGQGVNDVTHSAVILDKTYEVSVPKIPEDKSGEKRGEVKGEAVTGGTILWTVIARNSNASGQAVTFGAVEFYDNLTSVGVYVDGSFKIGTTTSALATTTAVTYDAITGELTYDLTSHSGLQYIQFETKIPSTEFFSGGGGSVSNEALLIEDGKDNIVMKDTVPFDFGWIKKKGAVEEFTIGNTTGSIRWTITANDIGASLKKVKIKDTLPDGLVFESASWTTYSAGSWTSPGSIITPSGAEYDLGDINTPVQLTIIAKVTDDIGHIVEYYTNAATITWEDYDGPGDGVGSRGSTVGIGVNPVGKVSGKYDIVSHEIPWTVTVSESDVSVDLYTMDLFVYGTTLSSVSVSSIEVATSSGPTSSTGVYTNVTLGSIKANIDNKNLTRNVNQKYVGGSFTAAAIMDLGYIVYTLKDSNGNAVADLLVVAKANGDGMVVTPTAQKFEFKTKVTNPQIYASNKKETIRNEVALFSANKFINKDHANADYSGRMLAKDMLNRNHATDAALVLNKNESGASNSNGFNYEDHTVVFRLHVNANNLDFTNDITTVDGVTVGPVTLTDKLPDGWEFVPIVSGGPMFYIYEGTPSAVQGKVTATGSAISPAAFVVDDITEGATTASFTFNTLDKPYLILVRAKITDDLARDIFSKNISNARNFINEAEMSSNTGYKIGPEKQTVSINNKILTKAQTLVSDGAVKWSVEYRPNTIGDQNTSAEAIDTLPIGLELRTDANGKLLVSTAGVANLEILQLTLKADGTYGLTVISEDVQAYIDSGKLSYDVTTRALTWVISDPAIAYRFSYITDVTGDPGTLKNTVKLTSSAANQDDVKAEYNVSDKDVEATMKRGGWIEITKYNGTSGPAVSLAGIEFRLWTEDGNTVLRSGTTGLDGKVFLAGLPVNSSGGAYILEEFGINSLGYKPLVKIYEIEVKASGSALVTSINGDDQEINIYNYKKDSIGNVEVTKTLSGQFADKTTNFAFTINADKAMGPFEYDIVTSGAGVTTGIAVFTSTGYAFTLKGDQTIVFKDVPFDKYTVNEADYSGDDYVTYVDGKATTTAAITISAVTTTAGLEFQNSREGWIEITKTDADTGDLLLGAEFTLYEVDGATVVEVATTDALGKIRFNNLDIGKYKLRETSPPAFYDQQYQDKNIGDITHDVEVVTSGGIFTLINGVTTNAISLVNYKNATVGDLLIKKTLSGNNTSYAKEFEFTVLIPSMAGLTASAIGGGGKDDQIVTFSATGAATIVLKGGQSLRIKYIPKDYAYTVTEEDYSSEGYKTTITGENTSGTGIISQDAIKFVFFNNHKSKPYAPKFGNLIVSKMVSGPGGDKSRDFTFRFNFPGDTTTLFEYEGPGVANGTIKHGQTFTLSHGQSITIKDLPDGEDYEVVEWDYSDSGYTTTATGNTGTIEDGVASLAKFVNHNDKTDKGDQGKDPDILGDTDKKVPKTGDSFLILYWIYVFLVSNLAIFVLRRRYRRIGDK